MHCSELPSEGIQLRNAAAKALNKIGYFQPLTTIMNDYNLKILQETIRNNRSRVGHKGRLKR